MRVNADGTPGLDWRATIPHGLPLVGMPWSEAPGNYLALVGRLSPEKGIAEAIELASSTGHRLRIAAKAIEPGELAMLDEVVRPAAAQGVDFLGEVSARDRDPLLAGALATLMLGAWPEPFGLVAIESLATGTPVIARRAGALPEIVAHGVDGFLVDDLDEARLAVRCVRDLDRAVDPATGARALRGWPDGVPLRTCLPGPHRGDPEARAIRRAGTLARTPASGGLTTPPPDGATHVVTVGRP